MKQKIFDILSAIKNLQNNPSPENTLPQNAYYLNKNEVVCCERKKGVSRYPLEHDGLVLFASSNGLIEAYESTFNIFRTIPFCEDPSVTFYGGLAEKDGTYNPVALFETEKQLKEQDITRYTVFGNKCIYYIAETPEIVFSLRVHIDTKKHIHFSFCAFNKTDTCKNIYMFSMLEAILKYADTENFWARLGKFGKIYGNSYILSSKENCLTINKSTYGNIENHCKTVGKSDIIGNKKTVINAECLLTGTFADTHAAVNTADIPVAADIYLAELEPYGETRIEFDLSYHHSQENALKELNNNVDVDTVDRELKEYAELYESELNRMQISFKNYKGNVNGELFNKFLYSVQNQVNICAFGKNYVGSLIGIRDVFQQIEAGLMWNPEKARRQIVSALNFILEDGRPPRQYSFPEKPGKIPVMNLQKYIDQGLWVISTVYEYLAFTDDYSILDEVCTYYTAPEEDCEHWEELIGLSSISDTVLDHLIKIMAFLMRNIDDKYGTNCLRILRGDWNDALAGLGFTDDPDKKFGYGVSVMASEQFYRNCEEMCEILQRIGKYTEKISEYKKCRENLAKGLLKYAIDTNENGERKIIHGWGDKLAYKIGSFNDPDGVSRTSSTANSYFAISGMIKNDLSLKQSIVTAFNNLNSKYGLLTFDKPFAPKDFKFAGPICNLTPGTYENSAAYVHASIFATIGLFAIGESRRAWEEIEKSVVITHENCTMTPFVMPNSYCYNPEWGMDGDSMGDWYTGSGCALLKSIVRYAFGISPTLNGINITLCNYMPCDAAQVSINIKGKNFKIFYENNGTGNTSYEVNGILYNSTFDETANAASIFVPTENLTENNIIRIQN